MCAGAEEMDTLAPGTKEDPEELDSEDFKQAAQNAGVCKLCPMQNVFNEKLSSTV